MIAADRSVVDDSSPTLCEWIEQAFGERGYVPARHHRLLIGELERLSHGDFDRLMIQMPPGSAKSTYASTLLPAWWFTQHPRALIIAAAHTAGLAAYFGKRTRSIIEDAEDFLGYDIVASERASGHWSTSTGGEYYGVGVRGAIIGRRADLAIIDDPVKSQAEADSKLIRDRLWDWYRSDLIPRLKPGGQVILVMTRWHQDDLCGRLLEQSPQEWQCVRLPALAEETDPLHRGVGDPLWPEWEGLEALARRRLSIGERAWRAQYQQSPSTEQGSVFAVNRLEIIDMPSVTRAEFTVRAWDLAATAAVAGNDPDWTVGVKLTRQETGRFVVLDVVRMRGTPRAVEEGIVRTAALDGRDVRISLPEDPGQAGKSQVTYLVSRLAGFRVQASRESGPKTTRAAPVSSQMEAGNFALARANWNHEFIDELRDFPFGRKDDQVDALSRAFEVLLMQSSSTRRTSVSFMDR